MKKFMTTYVAILMLLFPLSSTAQTIDSLFIYKQAFKYISRDLGIKKKRIAVSNKLQNFDSYMFLYIDSVKGSNLEMIVRQRQERSMDPNARRDNIYSFILDKRFNKISKHTEYALFFSYIEDGIVLAEIGKLQKNAKSTEYWTVANTALQFFNYMFIYDSKNILKQCVRVKME